MNDINSKIMVFLKKVGIVIEKERDINNKLL